MEQACALMGVYPFLDRKWLIIEEKVLLRCGITNNPCIVMGHFHDPKPDTDTPYITMIVPTRNYQETFRFTSESYHSNELEMKFCAARDAALATLSIVKEVNPEFLFGEW